MLVQGVILIHCCPSLPIRHTMVHKNIIPKFCSVNLPLNCIQMLPRPSGLKSAFYVRNIGTINPSSHYQSTQQLWRNVLPSLSEVVVENQSGYNNIEQYQHYFSVLLVISYSVFLATLPTLPIKQQATSPPWTSTWNFQALLVVANLTGIIAVTCHDYRPLPTSDGGGRVCMRESDKYRNRVPVSIVELHNKPCVGSNGHLL